MRKKTRQISVGGINIGGGAPIVVQSMANTRTSDIKSTVEQIKRLERIGCEIVRVAVPDEEAANSLRDIKKNINIPLIADIHFQHKLALISLENGVDGLRINPGNIGSEKRVKEVVQEAKLRQVPIRIGVNSGSVEKDLLDKFGSPTPEALVLSALKHVRILEDLNFYDIKISVKASNVRDTIEAYQMLSNKVDYPLHLGVTEAGTLLCGAIKSALGIGTLLQRGIGDTIRVSLTAEPEVEIKACYEILASLGLRKRPYAEIISCPTCGRLQINLQDLVSRIEKRLEGVNLPIKIAVMGCVVNGPGEAKEADIGVAGGDGKGVIIKHGKIIRTCDEDKIEEELMKEIELL
ncbi:MAG: 4-hydroxy-3-methylbut-2-en-1-yl diphosphate synthase [Deltaproteobacteria bacterium CG07_land_8_20_14_0_80_38_7]|nr:MAG: 4-hydroxy-3-methylbut-2-en-1-yl diphosphate synthase [Deltaproteobacteria bacterium CG07_land_8_20_14_0_80_38_7]